MGMPPLGPGRSQPDPRREAGPRVPLSVRNPILIDKAQWQEATNVRRRRHGTARRGRARASSATDTDSPWKEALDRYFERCMALFFPQAHADIDWTRGYEMLDKELQPIVRQAKLGRRYVDKLVKVWLRNGEE